MGNNEVTEFLEDLTTFEAIEPLRNNLRKAVRYGRADIVAELQFKKSLLRKAQTVSVELRDISTRGAHLLSPQKLPLNSGCTLTVTFADGKRFSINGKVMHKKSRHEDAYGFKFDIYNDALGDYLLDTQTDLVFK